MVVSKLRKYYEVCECGALYNNDAKPKSLTGTDETQESCWHDCQRKRPIADRRNNEQVTNRPRSQPRCGPSSPVVL